MKSWGRVLVAMATPFNEQLEVDYEKAVALAKHLVKQGVTALVIAGTTGEAPTLTAEEKQRLFKVIKQAVDVPVIAGVGTNGTQATIKNAEDAEACGVDGLLVVVPYYNKPMQEGLYNHFKTVAEHTKLPIMLYNVPGRTSRNMDAETTIRLSKIPNITSMKEASGDLVQMTKIIRETDDDFVVYTGVDDIILPTLAIGGYGVVSVTGHVVAPQIKAMIDAYIRGEVQRAADIHQTLCAISQLLFIESNPTPVKAALNLLGIEVGSVRLPLSDVTDKTVNLLTEELKNLGIL
jgi:4-hydroxy-tetrahydrodipicolinate synthase